MKLEAVPHTEQIYFFDGSAKFPQIEDVDTATLTLSQLAELH